MNDELIITPASQWKRPTEVHTLPSGKVVRLKRSTPIGLIMRAGNIPDALAQIAIDAINGGGKKGGKTFEFKKQDLGAIADLMDTIAKAVFDAPAIVDNPNYDLGQIAITDVDDDDKIWVLTWAMNPGGEAGAASRFPEQPPGDVSLAQTG